MAGETDMHDHTMRKIGISVLVFLVLAVMGWVGWTMRQNTTTNQQTHDQVLINTFKLNQINSAQKQYNDLHDAVQGLEYRVGNLEQRQAKDEQYRESHRGHQQ